MGLVTCGTSNVHGVYWAEANKLGALSQGWAKILTDGTQ